MVEWAMMMSASHRTRELDPPNVVCLTELGTGCIGRTLVACRHFLSQGCDHAAGVAGRRCRVELSDVRPTRRKPGRFDESTVRALDHLSDRRWLTPGAQGLHHLRGPLQTLPGSEEPFIDTAEGVAGLSLHASVAVIVSERKKLERICRYITRPAVSAMRLSLTSQAKVRYTLKTPYRDGTTGPPRSGITGFLSGAAFRPTASTESWSPRGQGKRRNTV